MTEVHLVQHTHWDREWYFTDMDAQILADSLFTEAIAEVKRESRTNFTLDGQTSIVDEYVASHPDALADIKQLVGEGRLFVGPWYTQTDAVNVDPESILRNAIIGQLDAERKYGKPMKIGYLPDTFGFNANMPALLSHVGLSRFIFWRGMNYDSKVRSPYFKWVAPGGAVATAVNLPPTGYSAAHMTDEVKKNVKEYVTKRLDPTTKFVSDIRGDKVALLPVGMDQMNIVHHFPELLAKINQLSTNDNLLSNYPAFFAALKDVDMPTYSGELRDPVYARVHRSIGSVRSDLKQLNAHSEIKLLRRLEPLMVIAAHNHIHVSTTMLAQVWKLVLECQAHDSMGGSVTDNVAIDIEHRFKQANELIDGIENLIKYKLAEILQLNDHQLLLFNPDVHSFEGAKTFSVFSATPNVQFSGMSAQELLKRQLTPARPHAQERTATGIKEITEPEYYELTYRAQLKLPALGYKVFDFVETTNDTSLTAMSNQTVVGSGLTVTLNAGAISVVTGSDHPYQIQLVECGNDGDTYDFSPLSNDSERVLCFDTMSVQGRGQTQVATFRGQAVLPVDLEDRIKHSDNQRILRYSVEVTVGLKDEQLSAKLLVDNNVNSHRMRLLISDAAGGTHGIAQIQDAFEQTPEHDVPDDWQKHYVEKPVNIYAFNKTVSLVNNGAGVATLITNDMHEYETHAGKLYATLFAGTGQLGKPNLAWRPGRASGDTSTRGHIMMATPLAQTLGKLEYDFALQFADSFKYADVIAAENEYLAANVFYQRQEYNLFANRLDNKIWPEDSDQKLPVEQSVFELPAGINVAAIYPAFTDNDSFVIRVVNLTNKAQPIPNALQNQEQIDGLEKSAQPVTEFGPFSITSFKIKF